MGRLAVRILFIALAGLVVAGAGMALWGYDRFHVAGPLGADTVLIVPSGAGLETIARRLEESGVVADRHLFAIGARLTKRARRMRAGEYVFPARLSMDGAIALLVSGRTVRRRLTIAEGLTTPQALAVVAAADGLSGAVPSALGEGILLPETYFYSYGDTRDAVVTRMRRAMRDTLAGMWPRRAPGVGLRGPDEVLVLASIIEKETGVARERTRISAVFHNRLRRGMRLQSDPTVVYAIRRGAGPLGRRLTKSDLAVDSPYNTYRIRGLPPGPIANPGRASILAALNPAKTKDLYFVADGNGGHVFARTLAEHNRNVAKWRRLRKKLNPN